MKTQLIKNASLVLTLLSSSYAIAGNTLDKNYDYAYYIMSPKNHQSNNGGEKSLRLTAKSAETKSVNFQGTIEIPKDIKVNAALVRVGSSAAYLTFDNVQCKYETKVSKLFYNYYYPLVSCSDGSRAGDQVQVQQKISLYLKEAKIFPATAYATINVAATFVKGISLPQLDADKGQILRFDGELWVPEDYIPDGQAAGDVLVWDGLGWTASKITGVAGEKGEKGEKGDTGATGPQGPQGLTGPAGMVGPAGVQGAAGPQGPAGAVGAKGEKGDKGEKGETGAIGPQGPAGATGTVGPKGATGATGPQGPQGLAGADGATGAMGPQGPAGATGAKGEKGDTGAMGPQGPAGIAGATGAQGPQGPAGATGAAGAKGDKGDKGEKGDAGDPGLVSLTAGAGILGGTISGNGGVIAVNTGTSAGQIPVIGTNGRLPASIVDTSQKIIYIKDVKANGTHGGTCDPAKAWDQVRDLNSVSGNTTFASLSANTITLAAGTYDIDISAPAYLDGFHKAALANAQTGEMVLVGSNARSHNVSGGMESSRIVGTITLAEPTSFVIKHRCATLSTSIGFGAAVSFGVDEVYTQVKIIKQK